LSTLLSIDVIKCDLQPTPEMQQKIDDLAASIQEQGLFHALTVHELNTSPVTYEVIAGRKRFLALKANKVDVIPCEVKQGLNDFQVQEVSLHENLKRGQLPWYEEVELVQQLHDLRQRQHGLGIPNRPSAEGKKGWGVRDTAKELDRALGGVSEDLQLARLVRMNPALKNIKDRATAIRVVKQTAKRMVNEEEAVVSGDVSCADEVYLGEAVSILSQLPQTVFDFCITDPPWMKFEKSDDPTLKRDDFTLPVFQALYRTMKFDSIMYMFVGADDFEFYKKKLPNIGWKVQGHPCVWVKEGSLSRTGVRSWEHGRDLELILVAAKGSPVLASSTQVSSIFHHAVVPSKHLIHPNEKPVGLLEKIAKNCSYVGSLGVDPFGGSGSFGVMCDNLKRHYTIIEREHDRYKKIMDRLSRKKASRVDD
jgi:hypothetical protein